MELLLIRHGQSEADVLNVHEGRADFPLTPLGRRQARAMADRVKKDFPPDEIWSSPLKRASEAGVILQNSIGCPLYFDDDLMEWNNGILAGMSREEGKKHPIPKTLHDRIENGESTIEFRMRNERSFSRILGTAKGSRIAIVAHGGVINNLLRAFYQMPLRQVNKDFWFRTADTGIHYLEMKGEERWTHFLNNTAHLEAVKV
ncbi:MAG: histidine phosphatase family protein [Tuberibacillus sp.]